MELIYNNKPIKNNDFLKVYETQIKPEIKLNVDREKSYILIMYDPDAIMGTYVHWIVSNIKDNDISKGTDLLIYKGPAPPAKTGKHRYIFELYEQQSANLNQNKERNISIENLRKILNLGGPIYKIQFISQNDNGGRKTKRAKNVRRQSRRRSKY